MKIFPKITARQWMGVVCFFHHIMGKYKQNEHCNVMCDISESQLTCSVPLWNVELKYLFLLNLRLKH